MLEHKPDKRALKIVPMTQACMHGYDLQYNQIFFYVDLPVEKISAATARKASDTMLSDATVMLSCRATLR